MADTAQKMVALMRRLRVEMNGAVTDSMREKGMSYGLNYGVSIPTIKDVAADHFPDHELAESLWKQDVRELKLAALYIDDPKRVSREQMNRWSADWKTAELTEQSAMQLFWKSPDAEAVITQWLGESDSSRRTAAYYMLGRLAGAADKNPFTSLLCDNPGWFGPHVAETSAVYALREIYRNHPVLQEWVRERLPHLPPGLSEELSWQLDYL